MKKLTKKAVAYVSVFLLGITSTVTLPENPFVLTVEAHSGRTDSHGGHHDNKNKSGLGSYHYHCGGHPAHLHTNGICPYSSNASSTSSKSSNTSTSSSTVKKVQQALNKKGYSCGTADGKMGQKTISALKKFQKAKGLTVDGKIGPQIKKALGI